MNLLQKTSKDLSQLIKQRKFQVEMLEAEVQRQKEQLEQLEEKHNLLQEEMDEWCLKISELHEYKHPMIVSDAYRFGGFLQIFLDKLGVKNENLRATGEHWQEGFEDIRITFESPHRGIFRIHIFEQTSPRR